MKPKTIALIFTLLVLIGILAAGPVVAQAIKIGFGYGG